MFYWWFGLFVYIFIYLYSGAPQGFIFGPALFRFSQTTWFSRDAINMLKLKVMIK